MCTEIASICIPVEVPKMNILWNSLKPRAASSVRSFATAVRYSVNGQAKDVYKLETVEPVGKLAASEVALKFLAAPINPSDLNLAEGTYGTKPQLPAVGGNEGVAVVSQVGSSVKSLSVGDWVVPVKTPFGTWRQEGKADENALVKVPSDIPAAYAATLTINPATAYCLLRDFEKLQPGDVIIQNGANSMVGLAVIQMARQMGVKTINVVRELRPDSEKTLRLLTNLGGDINIFDSYLNSAAFLEITKDLPPIKLALNCVGGEVATDLARVLAPNGTLVTYGGMSKQPLSIPYDLLAYKQLKLKGFWISKWYESHSKEQASLMLNDIAGQVRAKQLSFFFRMHDLDDFDYALAKATEPFHDRKVVLNLDYPDRLKEHDARNPEEYAIFDTSVV